MKKIISIIIISLIIISCENQSQITYTETGANIHFENTAIKLSIDKNMKMKVLYLKNGETLSIVSAQSTPNDYLVINSTEVIDFSIEKSELNDIENNFGTGKQVKLFGKTKASVGENVVHVEKILTIELYDNFPNAVVTYVDYINLSDSPLAIDKIVNASYTVDRKLIDPTKNSYDFSLFQGCGVDWGIDYCNIKVDSTYSAINFMGITNAHRDPRGGGIPVLDLWGKEMGMAIAHISTKPAFVNLPIKVLSDGKIRYSIEQPYNKQYEKILLVKGEKYTTIKKHEIQHRSL